MHITTKAAIAMLAVAAAGFGFVATRSAAEAPLVVQVTAKRFEYMPPEIVLKKGVPIVLELRSLDRKHGFKVPALGVRADVMPDEVFRVELTPDKAGKFAFACDVFCGDGHEDMEGYIVVRE